MTKKVVYGTVTSVALVLAMLTIPGFLFSQEASAGIIADTCQHASDPVDPLEVRVEQFTNNDQFRTLVVEKEVFDCSTAGEESFVRDITIMIDKVENKFGTDLNTKIKVFKCDKLLISQGPSYPGPIPQCSLVTIGNTLSTDLDSCEENTGETFVELGSVSFPTLVNGNPSKVTKFAIVEKEILRCFSLQATTGRPNT